MSLSSWVNKAWSGADFWDKDENKKQKQQFAQQAQQQQQARQPQQPGQPRQVNQQQQLPTAGTPRRTNVTDVISTLNTPKPQIAPPVQPAPPTLQQQVNKSYGSGLSGIGNRLRDVVDPNTQADNIRRTARSGLNENFDQQQQRLTQQAINTKSTANSANQFSAAGLKNIVDRVGKAPGSIAQLQGRNAKAINKIDNPFLRTCAKLVTAPFGGLMSNSQADKNLSFGKNINSIVDNKLQQSSLGDKQGHNKWVRGAGQVTTDLPLQLATGGLGLVNIGAQTASDEANKAQASGRSNESALGIGYLQGGASALSEKIGIDRFLPGKSNVTGNTLVKALKSVLTEGAQEGQQQFTQNLIANKTYDPNQSLKEGVLESVVLGGLAGGGTSLALDTPNIANKLRQSNQTQQAPTKTGLPHTGEVAILSDYQESLLGKLPLSLTNQTHAAARNIAQQYGLDVTSGSPYEINNRINNFIENGMPQAPQTSAMETLKNAWKNRTPMNEGGYIAGPLALDFSKAKADGKVFDGVDGKPRFEVDDSGAKIKNPEGRTLGEVLDHPQLFKNYPELASMPVDTKNMAELAGGYMPKSKRIALDAPDKGTVLHETQHAIQDIEGADMSYAPSVYKYGDAVKILKSHETVGKELLKMADAKKQIDAMPGKRTVAERKKIAQLDEALQKKIETYKRLDAGLKDAQNTVNNYNNSSIEAEARAVQSRMNMPMSERYKTDLSQYEKRYHQTSKEAAKAIDKEGFRLDNRTSGANDILPVGVNTKNTTKDLGLGDADNQLEVYFKKDANIKQFSSRDEAERFFMNHPDGGKFRDAVIKSKQLDQQFQTRADEVGRRLDERYTEIWNKGIKTKDDSVYQKIRAEEEKLLDDWGKAVDEQSQIAQRESTHLAKKEGWDGIHMDADVGSFGRVTDNTIILDPTKVNTESRLPKQSTFYDSLDVPKQDLIIRNDGGKAMSIDPLESLKTKGVAPQQLKPFNNNTDNSNVLNMSGKTTEVVMMSPDEYVQAITDNNTNYYNQGKRVTVDFLGNANKDTINKYASEMKQGKTFNMPNVDYTNGGQEGLHRALAAKQLGIDQIPVTVAKKAPKPTKSMSVESQAPKNERVYRSESADRYGIGQAQLGNGLYTGSKETAGRTQKGDVVTDGLHEYDVNPNAKILDSNSQEYSSIDSKASNDPSLKTLDGRAWQQRKADLITKYVQELGYDGVRRGTNEVVAMSDKALLPVSENAPTYNPQPKTKRGNFNEQVINPKQTSKSSVPKTLNEFDKAIGGTGDIESQIQDKSVTQRANSAETKKLMEAINKDDIITKAAKEAQQSGKEINFYAEKDANGRSVGIKRFDPRSNMIQSGFVTDKNGNTLGNHIKVDPTGLQVNVGGEMVNIGSMLGDVTKLGNNFKISSTMERNIRDNAPKEVADKLYKYTVANKIQNESNFKTELANERASLRERTKQTMKAKPRGVSHTDYKADIFDYIEGNKSQTDLMGKYNTAELKTIDNYAKSTRNLYDSLLSRANTEFEKYGLPTVMPRKDYITHINELMNKQSFVGEVAGQLQGGIADEGKQTTRGAVPGNIAGRTEGFKPSKQWNRFFQERKGGAFSKDPFKAVDAYLEPTLHNIHMTESGVRARAVESALRTASELKEMNTTKVASELSDSLAKFKAQGGNNELVRGFQEYANAITGKTQAFDRQIIDSGKGPALALKGWQKLQKIGGQATILGNVNSVLMQPLNQVGTLAQGGVKNYLKGTVASITGNKDIDSSPFITARQAKTDKVFKSKGQKVMDTGAVPLEILEMASVKNAWNVMHEQVKSEGIKGQDAIIETDRRTERLVAGRGIADRPELYRSTAANGVLQYTLEVNAQNKQFWHDLSPKQKATFMIATTGVNSILGAVTGNAPLPDFLKAMFDSVMDFADTSKDGSAIAKTGRAAQRLAGEAASMNPLVSAGANLLPKGVRQGMFGKESDLGRYDGTAAPVQVVKNAYDTVSNLAKGEFDKAANSALRTVPFGNQARKTKAGYQLLASGDVEVNPWNATRALAFGPNAIKDKPEYGSSNRISSSSSSKGVVNASSVANKGSNSLGKAGDVDSILKGQFNTKEGKQFLAMKEADKKAAAESDPEMKKMYDQYKTTKRINAAEPDRPEGLDKKYADVLNWEKKRTPQQREKLAYSQNDYDFKLAEAKYQESKLKGTVSRAEDINNRQKLRKAEVGKDFSKDTRESYNSLSKAELKNLVENDPNGKKIWEDAVAYGDKLVEAGLLKKNKLRTGGKGGGKGKGGGGKKGNSAAGVSSLLAMMKAGAAIKPPTTPKAPAIQAKKPTAVKLKKYAGAKSGKVSAPKISSRKGIKYA